MAQKDNSKEKTKKNIILSNITNPHIAVKAGVQF